jgi:hypothetical protein
MVTVLVTAGPVPPVVVKKYMCSSGDFEHENGTLSFCWSVAPDGP